MKNILTTALDAATQCYRCTAPGFFCLTPEGGNRVTCPCCGGTDFGNETVPPTDPDGGASAELMLLFLSRGNMDHYDSEGEDEWVIEPDIRFDYYYCRTCRIIFDLGCNHAENGCTGNVRNAHFIAEWENIKTGVTYDGGMPQFDNARDWFENAPNVRIIRMRCSSKKLAPTCARAAYPQHKHPEYYGCSLLDRKGQMKPRTPSFDNITNII